MDIFIKLYVFMLSFAGKFYNPWKEYPNGKLNQIIQSVPWGVFT